MDLKEAIYTRRAIREFTAEPITESVIRDLIDAAIQAPSAVMIQGHPGVAGGRRNVIAGHCSGS